MLDLYPIKNRLGKITPGVWRYCHVDEVIRKALGDSAANAMWFEDADLIARAPQDLAALVNEVERLRAAIANHKRRVVIDPQPWDRDLWEVLQ